MPERILKIAMLSLLAFTSTVDAASCTKSILVIGSGAAGMGAANQAKSNGCKVTVLEARNRTGGRINTETMGA